MSLLSYFFHGIGNFCILWHLTSLHKCLMAPKNLLMKTVGRYTDKNVLHNLCMYTVYMYIIYVLHYIQSTPTHSIFILLTYWVFNNDVSVSFLLPIQNAFTQNNLTDKGLNLLTNFMLQSGIEGIWIRSYHIHCQDHAKCHPAFPTHIKYRLPFLGNGTALSGLHNLTSINLIGKVFHRQANLM